MSDRWPQIVARLAAVERTDHGFRYCEPHPAAGVTPDLHQQRAAESALRGALLDRAGTGVRPHPGLALDAGCGTGVHLSELSARYSRVLAIDADPGRVAAVRGACDRERVACATVALQDAALRDPLLAGRFALVLCNQVLGHVASGDLPLIFDTLAALLEPAGHLLLAVPFTNRAGDDFRVAAQQADGTVRGRPSTPQECDRLIAAPEPGQLPVHHFALPTLHLALRSVGLAILEERPYNWFSYEHADLMVLARARG